jgi:hypothetical protein
MTLNKLSEVLTAYGIKNYKRANHLLVYKYGKCSVVEDQSIDTGVYPQYTVNDEFTMNYFMTKVMRVGWHPAHDS